MSRKIKESSFLADRFYEKIFKIKLKGAQELPFSPEAMKAIEQEYAIKYLESLNIEPTKANIAMILKTNPLKDCQFGAGWTNGRIIDTLTIIARQKKPKTISETKLQNTDREDEKGEKKSPGDNKSPDIKPAKEEAKGHSDSKNKIQTHRTKNQTASSKFPGVISELGNEKNEDEAKFQLDFDIEAIKNKYLYPFNQSKQKKAYQNLMDDPSTSYLPPIEKGTTNEVLNSLKYYFPFSHVKVPPAMLKQLQVPVKITSADIMKELKKFVEKFPFEAFPYQRKKVEAQQTNDSFQTSPDSQTSEGGLPFQKERANCFLKEVDIEKCKTLLVTEEFARIIGIVNHLAYWQVFGHLNPVQPDMMTKKQMILISMEQINLLRKKTKNSKLWSLFMFPMVILSTRMMVEFSIRNSYFDFFELEEPRDIALEKVDMLITNMFDPNLLYCRFAFFESEIKAVNKKFTEHIDETKFRSKRIYGTNPYIDLYFPTPESDFVRSLRQKRTVNPKILKGRMGSIKDEEIDEVEEEQEKNDLSQNKEILEQSYKVKMFQVLLDKIIDVSKEKKKIGIINYDREKL